jgi:TIGR03009 family protein
MRRAGLTLTALLAAAPAAVAQAPSPPPGSAGNPRVPTPGSGVAPGVNPGGVPAVPVAAGAVPAVPPALNAHLLAWEAKAKGVQNLYTECERVTKQVLLRKERTAVGSVVCMKPNLARMRMDFKDKPGEYEAYICDGANVYQYDGAEKTLTPHRIPPGGQGGVGDSLLLEFMSGSMTADDVKRRFDLKLLKEEEFYVHLEILPRLAKDKQEFEKLLLVLYGPKAAVRKLDYLPAVVVMSKDNGQTTEQWTFKNMQANVAGITKEQFAYVPPPKDWTVKQPAAAVGPAPVDPRVARPAAPGGR